jgi:hypothetical protein
LQRQCEIIERRLLRGGKLLPAVRACSKRLAGRYYTSRPLKTLALSAWTIRRCYRAWEASGRKATAFQLGYRPISTKRSFEDCLGFARTATSTGATSFQHGEERAYRYAMPTPLRAKLRKLFAARRLVKRIEAQIMGMEAHG